MINEIITFSAANLAQRIRLGELSPLEVIQAFISRVEAVNPTINALVTPLFEQALADAKKKNQSLTRNKDSLPPLYGVPVTVKDSFAVEGSRFTAGAKIYQSQFATRDAKAVKRLKAAGAIVLGKTNCPDLCSSAETRNLIFGLTRNAWNQSHSAGGSSGGEATLIACGGSPLGLGSDIAGSIRLPAAFCGVFGYKPTPMFVPLDGHLPEVPRAIRGWNTVGPLARHAEDLVVALEVLSGEPIKLLPPPKLMNWRVILPTPIPTLRLSDDVESAVRLSVDALQDAKMEIVIGSKLPLLDVAFEFSAIMEREWLPGMLSSLGGGKSINLMGELTSFTNRNVSPNVIASLMTIALIGCLLQLKGYGSFKNLHELKSRILDSLEPHGLLMLPVFHKTAPRHGFVWLPDGSPTYTSVFNALGFPACAVPVGLSDTGLPLSVQIVGRPGDDVIVLSVAAFLEDTLGVMPLADVGLVT